jgi:hypothetical protein
LARVRKERGLERKTTFPPRLGKVISAFECRLVLLTKILPSEIVCSTFFLIAARTLFIAGIVVIAKTISTYNFERTRGEIGRHRWRNRDGSSRFVDNGFRRGGSL